MTLSQIPLNHFSVHIFPNNVISCAIKSIYNAAFPKRMLNDALQFSQQEVSDNLVFDALVTSPYPCMKWLYHHHLVALNFLSSTPKIWRLLLLPFHYLESERQSFCIYLSNTYNVPFILCV